MADQAHEWTEGQIAEVQAEFHRTYAQASKEMGEKLERLMADYSSKRERYLLDVQEGRMRQADYDAWLEEMSMDRDFVSGMARRLASDATNADRLAMDAIRNRVPMVYAECANYEAFAIESEVGFRGSFNLYDQSTVRRLILAKDDKLLPRLKEGKDRVWNERKLTSAVTQSVLQGESIPNASKRIQSIIDMDERAAARAARTAIGAAENAGRLDSLKRAVEMGIEVEKQWVATPDERTRSSHVYLDGEHVPVDKPFSNGLMYPKDPNGEPGEVYNCRCTMKGWTKDSAKDRPDRWQRLPKDMTYEDWKKGKEQDNQQITRRPE